jgi:hypothetical protein
MQILFGAVSCELTLWLLHTAAHTATAHTAAATAHTAAAAHTATAAHTTSAHSTHDSSPFWFAEIMLCLISK